MLRLYAIFLSAENMGPTSGFLRHCDVGRRVLAKLAHAVSINRTVLFVEITVSVCKRG